MQMAHDDADGGGQVSETSGLGNPEEPISPADATAGDPGDESGDAEEGEAGPDAAPDEGSPRAGDSPGR